MASEDSGYRDRCLRFIDVMVIGDAPEPVNPPREVRPRLHHSEDGGAEGRKSARFELRWVVFEERNDSSHEIAAGCADQHNGCGRVSPEAAPRLTAPEPLTEEFEDLPPFGDLGDVEFRLDLPANRRPGFRSTAT